MRDAKDLHADLKRTASSELMHQQQVEAEEQQSIAEEPGGGLEASLSCAVKQRLNFGKKASKGDQSPAAGQGCCSCLSFGACALSHAVCCV